TCRPFTRAPEHPLQFVDHDHLDRICLDLPHQCLEPRSVHRTARICRIREAGYFIPSLRSLLPDEVTAKGRLALARVKSTANLVDRRYPSVDRSRDGARRRMTGYCMDRSHRLQRVEGRSTWPRPVFLKLTLS